MGTLGGFPIPSRDGTPPAKPAGSPRDSSCAAIASATRLAFPFHLGGIGPVCQRAAAAGSWAGQGGVTRSGEALTISSRSAHASRPCASACGDTCVTLARTRSPGRAPATCRRRRPAPVGTSATPAPSWSSRSTVTSKKWEPWEGSQTLPRSGSGGQSPPSPTQSWEPWEGSQTLPAMVRRRRSRRAPHAT